MRNLFYFIHYNLDILCKQIMSFKDCYWKNIHCRAFIAALCCHRRWLINIHYVHHLITKQSACNMRIKWFEFIALWTEKRLHLLFLLKLALVYVLSCRLRTSYFTCLWNSLPSDVTYDVLLLIKYQHSRVHHSKWRSEPSMISCFLQPKWKMYERYDTTTKPTRRASREKTVETIDNLEHCLKRKFTPPTSPNVAKSDERETQTRCCHTKTFRALLFYTCESFWLALLPLNLVFCAAATRFWLQLCPLDGLNVKSTSIFYWIAQIHSSFNLSHSAARMFNE